MSAIPTQQCKEILDNIVYSGEINPRVLSTFVFKLSYVSHKGKTSISSGKFNSLSIHLKEKHGIKV